MTSTRGAGHFGPLRAFADGFARAGHRVLIAVPEEATDMVRRAGHEAWSLPEPDAAVRDAVFARTNGVSNDEANAIVVGDLFAGVYARAALPGVLAVVADFVPDAFLHESSEYAGPLAAEHAGLPAAHVAIGLASFGDDAIRWAAPQVDALRREHGFSPDPRGERLYDRPTLSLTPPALDGAATVLHYREPRPDRAPLPAAWAVLDRPLVYLSFGSVVPTTGAYPGLYRAAIEQIAPLPVTLLVSTGNQDPAALGRLPANVVAERWVDEAAVGHHAAAVVTHGGAGSVRGALAAGVPLVAMPMFADQPHNAHAVAAAGAGIAVDHGPDGLGDALRTLLDEPAYGRRAREIAEEVAALPPVEAAIEVLLADERRAAAGGRPT